MTGTYIDKIGKLINKTIKSVLTLVMALAALYMILSVARSHEADLRHSSVSYAEQLNTFFSEKAQVLQSLEVLAANKEFSTYEEQLSIVDSLTALDESVPAMYIAYPDNSLVYTGGWKPEEGFVLTDRVWYEGASKTDGVFVSDPYVDETTGNMCVTLSKAVMEGGSLKAVVGMDIYITEISSLAEETYKGGNYIFITTANGTIVTHPNEKLAMTIDNQTTLQDAQKGHYKKLMKNDKIVKIIDYNGIKNAMSSSVACNGWKVISVNSLFSTFINIIITVALFIVVYIVTTSITKSFTKKEMIRWFAPIGSVCNKVTQIAEGDLTVEFDEEAVTEEVAQLTYCLNDTVEQLRFYIQDIENVVQHISNNDLTVTVEGDYKGSFVEIKNALQMILDRLNDSFERVNEQSSIVVSYSGQVQTSTLQVASGSAEQSAAITDLADSIAVLSDQIARIEQNAEEASSVSEKTNQQLQEGNQQMEALVSAMNTITDASKQIGAIVTTINDLAEQTNLLSLNASIEAARAGEAGRGFAVVAGEISKLAEASSQSSLTITRLIDNSNRAVEEGKTLVDLTAGTLEAGIQDSLQSRDKILEITEFVRSQNEAVKKIEMGIQEIAQVIETNAAASQENTAISDELITCANTLLETVEGYKLRSDIVEEAQEEEMPEEIDEESGEEYEAYDEE